jgi:hypothetical protein
MDFKKISVEITEEESTKIKDLLGSIGDIRNSISIRKLDGNKDQKVAFYTFTIEEEVLKDFVIKLKNSRLKVVSQDEINEKLRTTIKSNAAYSSAVNTDLNSAELQTLKKKKRIEDFIEEGNYSVLLDILRDIRLDQNKRLRAESAIPATVKKAIEINFEEGMLGKRRAFTALEELVNIATNPQLKNLRLGHILDNSGYKAIELCTKFDDFADELIKIANNIKMPNIISIKAVIKFAELTLRDNRNFKYSYEADIVYAVKNTNLRWLRIAWDSVFQEISEEEKAQYDKFMSFIEFKKLGN